MSYKRIERFEATMSTRSLSNYRMQGENPPFGEESVHELARRLRAVSLIDPVDLLQRISAGIETPLPKFSVGTATGVEPPLRRWDELERATPERLTPNQYQDFLEGRSPSEEAREFYASLYAREFLGSRREISRGILAFTLLTVLSALIVAAFAFTFRSLDLRPLAPRSPWMEWFEIAIIASGCLVVLVAALAAFLLWRSGDGRRIRGTKAKWETKPSR
jgi:hypothetical protein